jgi:Tfp pilus assembly protein PilF
VPSDASRSQAANTLARAHREAGEVDLSCYLYAHSLEWAETAEARLGLAYAYAYAGRLEQAIEECRKAEAADPEDGRASNDRGVYLMQMGEEDQAVPFLLKATQARVNPERQHPFYNLGRIYERRKEFAAASEAYQAALKEDPDFTAARKAIDRVRHKGGLAE